MESMIEHSVTINGLHVDAVYSEQAVSGIFLPLIRKLADLQREKSRRILVMLSAPPGAGKSTLLSFLDRLFTDTIHDLRMQTIGMDGFHRRQEYLLSHFIERDHRQISMVQIKGAPITFDLPRLTEAIERVRAGEVCGWPVYDRLLHNPIEDALHIDGDIVLLEGNYLLLDEDGWRDLRRCADYTISITADPDLLRTRLIERRIGTGVAEDKAIRFVDFSDMPNVHLCLKKTMPADLQLKLDAEGEYHLLS